jgi:carbon storage regulator
MLPFQNDGLPMLVLTRKLDQPIVIGDRIKVTVLKIRGNRIQLGIEAPKEMPVMREELVRSAVAV